MRHMSVFTTRHPGRPLLGALLGVAVLSASLLARSLLAPAAHASLGGCRSDPIVTLSDGRALDLHATVSTTYDDVQLVTYTLHGPVGTWVTSKVDDSVLGPKASFQYYADQPPNTYDAAVQVTTQTPQIPVVAGTDLVAVTATTPLSVDTDSGQSPQRLWMNVSG